MKDMRNGELLLDVLKKFDKEDNLTLSNTKSYNRNGLQRAITFKLKFKNRKLVKTSQNLTLQNNLISAQNNEDIRFLFLLLP